MTVKIKLILVLLLLQSSVFALKVTIIESQFIHTGIDVDVAWSDVVAAMGHTPAIVPYNTLDDSLFFSSTDVLIVSAGDVGLSSSSIANILAFLKTGKPVYLQCEYLPNFITNMAFKDIVIQLGGSFEWENLFDDVVAPMHVLGSYSTTPNEVVSLDYYWYSVSGKGDCHMVNFLEFGGEYHGFQYIPENPAYGTISTTSDGDWVFERTSPALMENIIAHLIDPPPIPVQQSISLGKDTTICIGESVVLEAMPASASYLWQDGTTGQYLNVAEEGTYWVTAQLGCGVVTDSITVKTAYCDCFLVVPNIFSPNGDNINDTFSASSGCVLTEFSMHIYNRWGEMVFQSNDQYDSWDGTINGKDSPSGVSAYLIQYKLVNGEMKHSYGDVTLIR